MLPFDMDTRFIKESAEPLAELSIKLYKHLCDKDPSEITKVFNNLNIQHQKILCQSGSTGFRWATKTHPFWNLFLNGICIALAEENEPARNENAHSYRYKKEGVDIFDKDRSWRAYKSATILDLDSLSKNSYVVQTDISGFYGHIYHHKLENILRSKYTGVISKQVDRILSKLSDGRSFGLPVGGQGSRVLAEIFMSNIDSMLTTLGIKWHRYVDDYTLICDSEYEAYASISNLASALEPYGLSLNKGKTSIMNSKNYKGLVDSLLSPSNDQTGRLTEIDLHFDPYSDNPHQDYESLKGVIENIDLDSILKIELAKSQPDNFIISQISRSLGYKDPKPVLHIFRTLLNPTNIHAFRGSWKTIMIALNYICSDDKYAEIHDELNKIIDKIIINSSHLIDTESNCLYFLRVLKNHKNNSRSKFLYSDIFLNTPSNALKKACIECFISWKDLAIFSQLDSHFLTLQPEVQRSFWLYSYQFGTQGEYFRGKINNQITDFWSLKVKDFPDNFSEIFKNWAKDMR